MNLLIQCAALLAWISAARIENFPAFEQANDKETSLSSKMRSQIYGCFCQMIKHWLIKIEKQQNSLLLWNNLKSFEIMKSFDIMKRFDMMVSFTLALYLFLIWFSFCDFSASSA